MQADRNVFLGEDARRVFLCFTGAAVLRRPFMVVGDPGCGKTDPLLAAASFYVHGDETRVWRQVLGEGTPPSLIEGAIDVKALALQGHVSITQKGTPYDPDMLVVVLDEVTRANVHTLSAMLDLLDPKDDVLATLQAGPRPQPKVIVATSNFSIHEISRMGRYGETLHALDDRMVSVWIPSSEIPAVRLRDMARSSVWRDATLDFAQHQRNIVIHPDRDCIVPRANEMEAFHAVCALPPVAAALRGAAALLRDSESSSPGKTAFTNVTARMEQMLGERLSPRRSTLVIDAMILPRLFGLFRAANAEAWREAHASDHPAAWKAYVASIETVASRWTPDLILADVSPLSVELLRFAFPAQSEEQQAKWADEVDAIIGGDAYVKTQVRRAYSVCVGVAAPSDDGAALQSIMTDLMRRGHTFAAMTVAVYAALAERMLHPQHMEASSRLLCDLDPKSWPPDSETTALIRQLAQEFAIHERLNAISSRGAHRVRRVS